MSRDEGFSVMDVETTIAEDAKFKRLARVAPDRVLAAGFVYVATMGASWKVGHRVTVEDAWPAYATFDPLIVDGLQHVGLLDAKGRVQPRAWRTWFEKARQRREQSRADWRRWQQTHRNRTGPSGPSHGGVSPDSDSDKSIPSVRPSVRRERTIQGVQQPTDIARARDPWSSWAADDPSEKAS